MWMRTVGWVTWSSGMLLLWAAISNGYSRDPLLWASGVMCVSGAILAAGGRGAARARAPRKRRPIDDSPQEADLR